MRSEDISAFLSGRIAAGDFPSAVYLVAEKGQIVFQDAIGHAVADPESIEAKIDTIYDLASLTKPLITGLLSARLLEGLEFELDSPAAPLLTGFNSPDKSKITVKNLLVHTSGLLAWRPFYLSPGQPYQEQNFAGISDRAKNNFVLEDISSTPVNELNVEVVYSDLNFILLGFLLEQFYDRDLNYIAVSEILARLGLTRSFFGGLDVLRHEVAASEKGNQHEKRTCIELGFLKPGESDLHFRDYQIWGEVHDGNAWFLNGIAGHAGLFSTAEEVLKIALQFLPDYTTILKPKTTELFRTNFTPGMNEARSVAFQLAETPKSTAGSLMSPQAYGHLGFTGTSLWIDPVTTRIFILLTNRTHAHELPFVNINSVRRRFHDLANERLEKKG